MRTSNGVDDVAALGVASHQAVACQSGERVERPGPVAVEVVGELVDGDHLVRGEDPAQHHVPGLFVGAVVALELETPEAAAEIRQRGAFARGGRDDVAEEHRVSAADDLLGHLALERRDRLGEHGDVAGAAVDGDARELVRPR